MCVRKKERRKENVNSANLCQLKEPIMFGIEGFNLLEAVGRVRGFVRNHAGFAVS